MIKVGYTRYSFAEKRNFLDLPFNDVVYHKCYDRYTLYRKILSRIKPISWEIQFGDKPLPFGCNVDVFHFFNTISFGEKPYITTFETTIPRWKNNLEYGLSLLTKRNMLQMVAISNNAALMQKKFIMASYPQSDHLLSKLSVIPPSQQLHITSDEILAKQNSEKTNLIIVGHLFFLKGGKEALQVCVDLIEEGLPITLTIVSNLEPDTEVSRTDEEDVLWVKKQINKYKKHITWHSQLPNEEVIYLLKKSHVALFPTFADTYGYFALEAQACGCPVISTNIRALPEINGEDRGWLISVPQNEIGQGIFNTNTDLKIFRKLIKEKLLAIMYQIINNRKTINQKAEKAIDYIRQYHSPHEIATQYRALYEQIKKS